MKRALFAGVVVVLYSTALLTVPSASANSVPTHGRSSYGSSPSNILSTSSFTVNDVSLNGENFCSFSNSSGDECALSEAYQITSTTLPAGTTGVTITVPTASGSTVEILPPASVGILTNDSPGGNIYFSPLTQAQVSALPSTAVSTGVDGSGNAFITINDLSLLPDLAFYVDLLDVSDPFGDGSGHFCSDNSCVDASGSPVNFDVPKLSTPEVTLIANQKTAPEPGTLLSLISGLSLLGFVRRRSSN